MGFSCDFGHEPRTIRAAIEYFQCLARLQLAKGSSGLGLPDHFYPDPIFVQIRLDFSDRAPLG